MPTTNYGILLVEDEGHMVATIEMILGDLYRVRSARSAREARQRMAEEQPDLVLLDLGLPDEPGAELLRDIRKTDEKLDVIVVTGSTDVSSAVEVMKLNALDYIQKPFEKADLLLCVQNAYERWKLRNQANMLRTELFGPFRFGNIVARSSQMVKVMKFARKMCQSEATVLITGESGTGKELVARAIHSEGTRRHGPFVAVNCAQFTGALLESELFGHEKGAFTGATSLHKGRFELADEGTLFLDEVGNTSLEMQAKILRAVETKQFERVGGQRPIDVDVRIIAATNADLQEKIRRGEFREDLFYRLNVVPIEVPPLRSRKEDIPALCEHFLTKLRKKTGRHIEGVTPEAMEALCASSWKGNVRELQNVIEMAVALEEGEWVTTRYLPPHIILAHAEDIVSTTEASNKLMGFLTECERFFIEEQLRLNGGNHRQTARRLGMHRNTMDKKIKKYGIKTRAMRHGRGGS